MRGAPPPASPQDRTPKTKGCGGTLPPKKGGAKKPRRREKKNISHAHAHIKSSFNNTLVTITDPQGNTIAWASSGNVGFKGSRKSTPFAAQLAAEQAARRAQEHGVRKVDVYVKAPGSGQERPADEPLEENTSTSGEIHRTRLQALPAREEQALPEGL